MKIINNIYKLKYIPKIINIKNIKYKTKTKQSLNLTFTLNNKP